MAAVLAPVRTGRWKVVEMEDVRCKCKKIVCQVQGSLIIIKCRHCKRFIVIDAKELLERQNGTLKVEFR